MAYLRTPAWILLAYRKDLFENEEERAAFKEEYGYELTVPEDWDTYRDVAEFSPEKKERPWQVKN